MKEKAWPVIYQEDAYKIHPHIESWIDRMDKDLKSFEDIAKELYLPTESIIHAISCRLFDLGEINRSTKVIKYGLDQYPDPILHSQYLRCLMALPGVKKQQFAEENLKWAELYGKGTNAFPEELLKDRDTSKNKKLIVGFLCCYTQTELCRTAIAPTLRSLKQHNIHVVIFSIGNIGEDWLTSSVHECVNIIIPNEKLLSELILEKKIDILVDLNGRFRTDNPINVILKKSAPVIVSYGNMLGTYGLDTVKYMLADHYAVPPGDEKYYTENIFRFESGDAGTFEIPDTTINQLPYLKNKFITFGSFNALLKINNDVLETWLEILNRIPNSKLFIKAANLDSAFFKKRILYFLTKYKVHTSRIVLEKYSKFNDMLMKYNNIDIALNTFPYSGGTTIAYALWMGLPSITLEPKDDSMVSGGAAGVVRSPGFDDFVVSSKEEYIEKAVELSRKPEYLSEIRRTMRDRLKKTARFNPELFGQDFAKQLRAIWHHWLDNSQK